MMQVCPCTGRSLMLADLGPLLATPPEPTDTAPLQRCHITRTFSFTWNLLLVPSSMVRSIYVCVWIDR